MSKNEFLRGKPVDTTGEQLLSLLFKLTTFLIIIAGFWASTQRFCALVNYEPGWVGAPFSVLRFGNVSYPLYKPYLIFYWCLVYYKRLDIHPFLYEAVKIAGYTSVSAIVFYLFLEFIILRNRKQNIFGTARWATVRDLKKAGILGLRGGMILGETGAARLSAVYDTEKDSVVLHLLKPSRKIIQAGIYNTVLSAPTRSGKGVSSVIPTLLSYPGSVIVLDFKGENFNLTSGFRAKFGKVYRWEPVGNAGHHFNPMMEIRGGEDAFSDANLEADILTTPASGSGNATSEHFTTAARDFLTALILHCLCSDWPNKSLAGCREFLALQDPSDPGNTKYIYDLMINADHGDPAIHQSVVEGAGAQRKRPGDEGGSVLSTVNNALAVFADAKIKRNTQNSEFYIDEFVESPVPVSLYITIQYSDVQRISALIRMFVLLFSRRFTSGETQATNRKFKIPLLFILDEFDKLGKMEELHMNMGIHNGFGIHYFLIFQSINQLNSIYGKDHSFLAHCRNTIFYAPGAGEYDNAETISKICGRESVSRANISYSGARGALGFNNASLSAQDQERNLINADEVMKLPLDEFILICQGQPPYIGKKNVYYDDPVFKARLFPPAFTDREGALRAARPAIAKLSGPRWFAPEGEAEDPAVLAEQEEKLRGLYDDGGYSGESEEGAGPEDGPAGDYAEDLPEDGEIPNFLKAGAYD
ncbi:MAG: type IV secretory system conjugative DNA transfer family protein [Spirochaetaceae bacterium]|jgi:type IV secretion system protein VirD4|nr:type IV secretory system conjugative DNA transfer family protein [Spirochaetaceae bacterium]